MQNGNDTKTIRSTGALRLFLADLLISVKEGTVDLDAARVMVKAAGAINASFYVEVKAAQSLIAEGKVVPNVGDLPIGGVT